MNQLDVGFDSVYNRIKDELISNKYKYQPEIQKMQTLITELTELSVKLQVMEERNKVKMQNCMIAQRQKIKQSKVSSQSAASYYKNMANQHQGQSYFLDKKK